MPVADDSVPVIATKYTGNYRTDQRDKEIIANFAGNGSKSLHTSVEASLRKLRTDYIDLVEASLTLDSFETAKTDELI